VDVDTAPALVEAREIKCRYARQQTKPIACQYMPNRG
jgi:hypothetical protein